MISKFIFIISLFFLMATTTSAADMNITIVYNNVSDDSRLTPAWGMACIIQGLDKTILFDTGGDGDILLANMKMLGFDPKQIDIVILSHIHGDHTGGLWEFLAVNANVTVYLPASFPRDFKQRIEKTGARFADIAEPVEIDPNVYSTGQLGTGIKEQSLILKTTQGLVVITGCAHPGIVHIAKRASQIVKGEIYLLTGGFHLGGATEREIAKIIKELKILNVKKVGPSHCTGNQAREMFRKAWGDSFVDLGCGASIAIK